MRKSRKRANTIKKEKGYLHIITVSMCIIIGLCVFFAWYQADKLEEGILDVCANQQDAYVQLVLDQINLKDNREDQEIISEILGTLDASTNKYWTFSKDRDMLFVKDVVETNRYKGITAISYYDSESAKDFLENLPTGQVIHENIIIQKKEYVASGVAFNYQNQDYRLCLLTNKDVILNSNQFMVAEVEMIILVGFMMTVLLGVSVFLARRLENSLKKMEDQSERIRSLQEAVGNLNELLNEKEHYDTKSQVWSKDVLKDFFIKLEKKGLKKVIVARVHCSSQAAKMSFAKKASVLLDEKILRFSLNETDILLLCLQYRLEEAAKNLESLLGQEAELKNMEQLSFSDMDMEEYMQKLEDEV